MKTETPACISFSIQSGVTSCQDARKYPGECHANVLFSSSIRLFPPAYSGSFITYGGVVFSGLKRKSATSSARLAAKRVYRKIVTYRRAEKGCTGQPCQLCLESIRQHNRAPIPNPILFNTVAKLTAVDGISLLVGDLNAEFLLHACQHRFLPPIRRTRDHTSSIAITTSTVSKLSNARSFEK